MKLNEINIRDPFILVCDNMYYMYGSRAKNQIGFDVYKSSDLVEWSEPKTIFEKYDGFWGTVDFWAPEVHFYNGKFYMLATFRAEGKRRGTQILVSDTPDGKFVPHSDGAVTPEDWDCLDGTLYIEDGKPYMVFCHEWIQIKDGEVCAVLLSEDLKKAVGKPFKLWKATDAPWIKSMTENNDFITDGPYLYKKGEELYCIWSSFSNKGYSEGLAKSDNGKIQGNWSVCDDLIYENDGGHGMIFDTLEGEKCFIFHAPNKPGSERPVIKKFEL